MAAFDSDDDFGTIAIALVIMTLVVGTGLYVYNARDSVQTAWRIPMIDKTVPTVVPSTPEI